MRYRTLFVLSCVAALLACGGSSNVTGTGGDGSNGGGTPPPSGTVHIQDFSFGPETVTVKVGQTVKWINDGPSSHTTTSDAGVWSSSTLAAPGDGTYGNGTTQGGTFSRTFNEAGTFPYHCSNHPPNLYPHFKGVVVVTP